MLAFGSFYRVFGWMNTGKDGGAYYGRFDAYYVDIKSLFSLM